MNPNKNPDASERPLDLSVIRLQKPAAPWAYNDRTVCAHGVAWNKPCTDCVPIRKPHNTEVSGARREEN